MNPLSSEGVELRGPQCPCTVIKFLTEKIKNFVLITTLVVSSDIKLKLNLWLIKILGPLPYVYKQYEFSHLTDCGNG